MKSKILLLAIFSTIFISYAQDMKTGYLDATSQVMNTLQEHILSTNLISMTIDDEDKSNVVLSEAKGSPFLNQKFESGTVKIISSNDSFGFQMRYNIYSDEIEIQDLEKNKLIPVKKESDYVCYIGKDTFKYFEYTDSNAEVTNGYFVELVANKASLFLNYKSKFHPAQPASSPLLQDKPARFFTSKTYYLFYKEELKLISLKSKKFLESFGILKNQIDSFMKSNKLKPINEADLIKIINYFNSLLVEDASNN